MDFTFAAIGFTSTIAQVMFLRELFASLNGSELVYGIALTIWLLSAGCGSFIAGRLIHKLKDPSLAFIYIQLAAALLFPLELFLVRTSRVMFGVQAGTIPALGTVILICVVSIAPLCLLMGALFTFGSRLLSNIGRMYILESLGSMIGGFAFSFLLVGYLNSFQIAGFAGALLAFSSVYFYKNFMRKKTPPSTGRMVVFALVIAVNLVFIYPSGIKADLLTSRLPYRGFHLAASADSRFGRIAVIEDNGELSYFENGNLMFSTASQILNEEVVHLAFLESARPKKILLIGGSPGMIKEIQKHAIDNLDYVEFDPKLMELSGEKYPFFAGDGRLFLERTKNKYDLIMVEVGDPSSAALNRFYTLEFFRGVRE